MKNYLIRAVFGLAALAAVSAEAAAQDCYCCYGYSPYAYNGYVVVRYEPRPRSFLAHTVGGVVHGTREVSGCVAEVVTTLHPAIRVADCMGLIDRRNIVRFFRGY